jgi:hypothetical protein
LEEDNMNSEENKYSELASILNEAKKKDKT